MKGKLFLFCSILCLLVAYGTVLLRTSQVRHSDPKTPVELLDVLEQKLKKPLLSSLLPSARSGILQWEKEVEDKGTNGSILIGPFQDITVGALKSALGRADRKTTEIIPNISEISGAAIHGRFYWYGPVGFGFKINNTTGTEDELPTVMAYRP